MDKNTEQQWVGSLSLSDFSGNQENMPWLGPFFGFAVSCSRPANLFLKVEERFAF